MPKVLILFVSLFIINNIRAQSNQRDSALSRVISFSYSGFGDNIYSTMVGQLVTSNKPDSLLSVADAKITVVDTKGRFSKTFHSKKDGRFAIEFPNGTYSLLIEKKGFQPLKVENYQGIGDQFSYIEIVLEKGSQKQCFRIPDNDFLK